MAPPPGTWDNSYHAAATSSSSSAYSKPADAVGWSSPQAKQLRDLKIYVDELHACESGPCDRGTEIFLRNVPIEDYDEAQLKEWLLEFGTIERVLFLRSPAGERLNRGYVQFATHAEAMGLVEAFPQVANDEGNVKGSWSFSQRISQGQDGPYNRDVLGQLSRQLVTQKAQLGCEELKLVSNDGPLYFTLKVDAAHDLEALQTSLRSFLMAALEEQKNPVVCPCIVVRNIAPGWEEKELRLVFAAYGGLSAVEIGSDDTGRYAKVNLKVPDNAEKAAKALNNTQAGDGELIKECCTILCDMLDAKGRVVDQTSPDAEDTYRARWPLEVLQGVEKAERDIEEARKLKKSKKNSKRAAFKSFARGLKGLLKEVERLPQTDRGCIRLRCSVDDLITEASMLKKELKGETTSKQGWRAEVIRAQHWWEEGRAFEKKDKFREAYQKYLDGLKVFLEVIKRSDLSTSERSELEVESDEYLKKAERLQPLVEKKASKKKEKESSRPKGSRSRDHRSRSRRDRGREHDRPRDRDRDRNRERR